MNSKPSYFIPFNKGINIVDLPLSFQLMSNDELHPWCILASSDLQQYLLEQKEWKHNFGLNETEKGAVIGKMFGVLVVQTPNNELGYLAAFSGKLAGGNHHSKFVPPVFDLLTENSFLNIGMEKLTKITKTIKLLEEDTTQDNRLKIKELKNYRKNYSINLQSEIFNHYHFLNQAGEEKSLIKIFEDAGYKNPPAGAGECAGPKLLQYAFQHRLKPLALTEFWWGQSPKSTTWKHRAFYPCCKEKCEPILSHMLKGI